MKFSLALSNRKGIAMPMALLVITALTAALAAGFANVAAEITTNSAERGQNRAYNLAQTGLEQFVVLRSQKNWCLNCVDDPTVADSEWTRISLPGGYADVVAVKVRPMIGASNAVYFIRSRGVDTSVKLNAKGYSVAAERTVGVYATWNTSTMKVAAAWLSLSGLDKKGTGLISGIDQCGKQPPVAGVMVDKGDLIVEGSSFHPEGSPPVDTSNTFDVLKTKTGIDWPGIVLANAMPADIEIPGQNFPSASDFDNDPSYWPVIRIHTNGYALPNRGRGIIIADSNFKINGSNMWDGILLVGGQLTSDGNNTTAGATLSGLNFLIGGTPSMGKVDDSDANGQKQYVYNSCNVDKATSRMRRYVVMPNTWQDNLASW